MEIFSNFGVFIAIFLAFAFIIFISYQAYLSDEKRKSGWWAFAQKNNFVADGGGMLVGGSELRGDCCGHHMRIYSTGKEKAHLCVDLTLDENVILAAVRKKLRPLSAETLPQVTAKDLDQKFTTLFPGNLSISNNFIHYNQPGLDHDETHLQKIYDFFCELMDIFITAVASGGGNIPALQKVVEQGDQPVADFAEQLMRHIGYSTTRMWSSKQASLLCKTCLTRCEPHEVSLGFLQTFHYYGCRTCQQTRQFYKAKTVVAYLDQTNKKPIIEEKGKLKVNWFVQDRLFDFNLVEVVQATDEQIERLVVKIGNDTDPLRTPTYKKMTCLVEEALLSPHTINLLKQAFGKVVPR